MLEQRGSNSRAQTLFMEIDREKKEEQERQICGYIQNSRDVWCKEHSTLLPVFQEVAGPGGKCVYRHLFPVGDPGGRIQIHSVDTEVLLIVTIVCPRQLGQLWNGVSSPSFKLQQHTRNPNLSIHTTSFFEDTEDKRIKLGAMLTQIIVSAVENGNI